MDTDSAKRFGQTVAAQLRAEAAARKLPVVKLAKLAGINRETLDRWLKGERPLSVPTLYKVAIALGIEPSLVVVRAEERFASETANVPPMAEDVSNVDDDEPSYEANPPRQGDLDLAARKTIEGTREKK